MTENMKAFSNVLEVVRKDGDEGINALKRTEPKMATAISKRYGDVHVTYTPIIMIGPYSINNVNQSEVYYKGDNEIYYTEKIEIKGIKNYVKQSVLGDDFEICIIHNMERILGINTEEFEILVEKSIDAFIVTKYGCFDIFKIEDTNISYAYAIESCFMHSDIIVCPSKNSIFIRDLNKKISSILKPDSLSSLTENFGNENINILVNYELNSKTFFDDTLKNCASVYIDNKYFCKLSCMYYNKAMFTLKGKLFEGNTFESIVSVFGIRTKITSTLLSKNKYWDLEKDEEDDKFNKNLRFNSCLLRNIALGTIKNGVEDIKNKYYGSFVCSRDYEKIIRLIKKQFINYKLTFKKREGVQFTYGKLLFLNSEFMDHESKSYAVSLYKQYIIIDNNKMYKINEILVEDKLKKKVFIISLLEMACQVQVTKKRKYRPVLYFIPCNIIIGNEIGHILKDDLSSMFTFNKKVEQYIYYKMVEEFGDIDISDYILNLSSCKYSKLNINHLKNSYEEMKNITVTPLLEKDILQFMKDII